MYKRNELRAKIQGHLPIHGARLDFMARFILAVIIVRGVTLSTVASALNPLVLVESNEKRIERFFREVSVEGEAFAKLMLALLPVKTGLVITLDRTTWLLGYCSVNILMLGVAYKGLALQVLSSQNQKARLPTQKLLQARTRGLAFSHPSRSYAR